MAATEDLLEIVLDTSALVVGSCKLDWDGGLRQQALGSDNTLVGPAQQGVALVVVGVDLRIDMTMNRSRTRCHIRHVADKVHTAGV